MRPFGRYLGSKWKLAPHYGENKFETIVELFAGFAGYATYHNAKHAILVEKNPMVANIWDWLINVSTDEIEDIPDLIFDTTDLTPQPKKDLVGLWLTRGAATPKIKMGDYHGEELITDNPSRFWCAGVKQRLIEQVPLIRDWEVICGDYTEAPDIEATWFVDPPYQLQGKSYPMKFNDYENLAKFVKQLKGQVIVCESKGADWLPFKELTKVLSQQNKEVTEMVWTTTNHGDGYDF